MRVNNTKNLFHSLLKLAGNVHNVITTPMVMGDNNQIIRGDGLISLYWSDQSNSQKGGIRLQGEQLIWAKHADDLFSRTSGKVSTRSSIPLAPVANRTDNLAALHFAVEMVLCDKMIIDMIDLFWATRTRCRRDQPLKERLTLQQTILDRGFANTRSSAQCIEHNGPPNVLTRSACLLAWMNVLSFSQWLCP